MNKIEEVQTTWKKASEELGFDVMIPYRKGSKEYAGFIPLFGATSGTIFHVNDFSKGNNEQSIDENLDSNKIYQSILSYETYRIYSKELFVDTLRDWSYYGPVECKPSWY